jgi:hypothetical protein
MVTNDTDHMIGIEIIRSLPRSPRAGLAGVNLGAPLLDFAVAFERMPSKRSAQPAGVDVSTARRVLLVAPADDPSTGRSPAAAWLFDDAALLSAEAAGARASPHWPQPTARS